MKVLSQFKTSLKYKIFVCLILLIMLPYLLLNLYFYTHAETAIREKIVASNMKALKQAALNIENLVSSVVTASNVIVRQDEIRRIISAQEAQPQAEQLRHRITVLNAFSNVESDILPLGASVLLYMPNGAIYSNELFDQQLATGFYRSGWYAHTLKRRYFYNWYHLDKSDLGLLSTHNTELVAMSRSVSSLDGLHEAVLAITMEKKYIDDILRGLQTGDESYFIAEADGSMVLSFRDAGPAEDPGVPLEPILSGNEGFFDYTSDEVDYMICFTGIDALNWKLAVQLPTADVFAEIAALRGRIVLMNILFILPFSAVILLLFHRFLRPIAPLVDAMHRVENGDLQTRTAIHTQDELGQLAQHFNVMLDKLGHLIEENNQKQQRLALQEKEKESMRYLVLKSQVNPHFLFNTLNNIKWLAHINHDKAVADSIQNLGHLLEATVRDTEDEITLEQELCYLDDYIGIMELSHPGACNVVYDIEQRVRGCRVAKLLLQPLVENAFLHGLTDRHSDITICISARSEDDRLLIEVADDGCGFDSGQEGDLHTKKLPLNKLGIANTHQRIRLHCGEAYGLQVFSSPGQGTRVLVTLPLRRDEGTGR